MEIYLKLLLIFILSLIVPIFMLAIQKFLSPKRTDYGSKLEPYESGEIPIMDAWVRYPVRFYLIAFLFLLFDIEIAFIIPFVIVFKKLGVFAIIETFIFILILLVGWLYLYKKKAYKWE